MIGRTVFSRCIGGAALVSALVTMPGLTQAKGLFWAASSPRGTVYLLGSLHFGNHDMYPLPELVYNAFRGSDALAVEIDLTAIDPLAAAQIVSSKGSFLDGSKLQDNVADETWVALSRMARRFDMDVERFNDQRPWLASLSLSTMELTRNGFDPSLGIDRHFLERAPQWHKPIMELESLEMQLELFSRFSIKEQELLLIDTLSDLQHGATLFTEITAAWVEGDAMHLDNLLNANFRKVAGRSKVADVLLTQRNQAMIGKILEWVDEGKRPFVVVGAGHLVGQQGMVSLLEQRGFTLTQY